MYDGARVVWPCQKAGDWFWREWKVERVLAHRARYPSGLRDAQDINGAMMNKVRYRL